MSEKPISAVAVIGIDIGKNSFHVVGHDDRGAIVLRQKWSRGQVEPLDDRGIPNIRLSYHHGSVSRARSLPTGVLRTPRALHVSGAASMSRK
jgi:hypothetical protein